MTAPYIPPIRDLDLLTVAFPPMPDARDDAERLHIIVDAVWAPVTGEISRIINTALWMCEKRPVTRAMVAALSYVIERNIRNADAVRALWVRHGAPLHFVIPLAPGFDVVCEPFKEQR